MTALSALLLPAHVYFVYLCAGARCVGQRGVGGCVCMHTEVRVHTQTQHMRHDTTKGEEPFVVVWVMMLGGKGDAEEERYS